MSLQRHTSSNPCRICGGFDQAPRGRGERCSGFLDSTGRYEHCTREEQAGSLRLDERTEPPSFLHRLEGRCDCGTEHGPAAPATATAERRSSLGRVLAEYIYRDAAGEIVGRVTRHHPKDFRQWTLDTARRWTPGLHGTHLPLYQLDKLVAALREKRDRWVVVVEGEKDVDRLVALGLVATTAAQGARKWPADCNEHLRGARVVIIPDLDEPGWRHVETVANALQQVAREVHWLPLAPWGAEQGGMDISDWLDAGHTVDELRELIRNAPLVDTLPRVTAQAPTPNGSNGHKPERAVPTELTFTSWRDLKAEPEEQVKWTIDGLLPSSGVAIISAKPKVGKTRTAQTIAAAVATGVPVLARRVTQGKVLLLTIEERRSSVREVFVRMQVPDGAPLEVYVGAVPVEALRLFTAAIQAHRPELAIIDPLFRFMRVKDASDYAEVTGALEGVVETARSTKCSILLVHHNKKASTSEDGGDALLGSTAIFGAVDTAIIMQKRPDGVRTVQTSQRYGVDMLESVVTLDDRGRSQLGTSVNEFERAALIASIKDTLAEGERTETDLRELVTCSSQKLSRVLRDMVSARTVARSGGGRRGDPFMYALGGASSQDWASRAFNDD